MSVSLSIRICIKSDFHRGVSATSCTTLTTSERRFTYQRLVESVGLQRVFRGSHSVFYFFIPLYSPVISGFQAPAHCKPYQPLPAASSIKHDLIRMIASTEFCYRFFFFSFFMRCLRRAVCFKLQNIPIFNPLLSHHLQTPPHRNVLTLFVLCSTIPH